MTQDQLAVASDIDSSNIRSYKNGRAMMNVFSLVLIAEALAATPSDLLDGVTSDRFATDRPHGWRARPPRQQRATNDTTLACGGVRADFHPETLHIPHTRRICP